MIKKQVHITRIKREVRIMRLLTHPNIAKLYDVTVNHTIKIKSLLILVVRKRKKILFFPWSMYQGVRRRYKIGYVIFLKGNCLIILLHRKD